MFGISWNIFPIEFSNFSWAAFPLNVDAKDFHEIATSKTAVKIRDQRFLAFSEVERLRFDEGGGELFSNVTLKIKLNCRQVNFELLTSGAKLILVTRV